jgi:type I restriction enzyme S subunit
MGFELTVLGEFGKVQGGFAYKSKDFQSISNCPVLKIKNIRFGHIEYEDTSFISPALAEETNNWSTKEGDILISMTGSGPNAPQSLVGRVARVWRDDPIAWINQRVGRIQVKLNTLHPDFIFYLMSQKVSQEFLVSNSSGSANQANISGKTIELLPCPKLEFEESQNIANILRSLDEKIILNRQTNQTLEQMAQALFKSWFVDFDPVIDNALAAGNPIPDALQERAERRQQQLAKPDHKRLPDDIRQLFPSEFELTEALGWVPKGWEVGIIENIASTNANSWSKITAPKQVVYVDLANTKNGHIQETTNYQFEDAPSRARRKLDKGDTIIGLVRPGNRSFAYIHDIGLTGSTGFAVMKPNSEKFRAYLYFHLTQNDVIDEFARLADGAAYPAIRPEVISNFMCLIPMASTLYLYQNIVGGFLEKIAIVSMENKQLKGIRDTLLPKLISGELRLPTDTTEQVHNSN